VAQRQLAASIVPFCWIGPLRGLVAELAERGKVDYRTVWNFVRAEKLSFKKNRGRQPTGPSRHRAKAGPVGAKDQGRIEPERLVFIDETWTKTAHGMGTARYEARDQKFRMATAKP
jgi:hypothetical protein